MMHADWEVLCGRGDNLTVWTHGDFGHCFEQVVFVCGAHALLACISAYHFSRHQHRRLTGPIPRSVTLHFRFAISLLLGLAPLVLLALIKLLHPSWIDIISWSIKLTSWILHSGFVLRLTRLYHIHIRGPWQVVLSYLLTAASDLVHLRTMILHMQHNTFLFQTAEQYITFITTFFHILYVISLIPSKRPDVSSEIAIGQNVNVSVDQNEHSGLLSENQVGSSGYQSLSQPTSSHVQPEDEAGFLSKLSFSWAQRLMRNGSRSLLNSSKDLYNLPHKLQTEAIDSKFSAVLCNKSTHSFSERPVDFADSEESHDALKNPEVSLIQPSLTSHKQENPTHTTEHISLLSALNKAFGKEYYSLGILKFLSDSLNFVGPMLLNLLVSYMENSKEPTWHGYIYAGGLFASTFLVSLLSTQFNYLVNVTGLKIRAAIITTIYSKTLAVNSVSLSKFSSGEVVNFMSTDTDRIVNFCLSFHLFWSLPVQVSIALYLLYQQLGLAFLTGLGFTLLLIPLNYCIVNKIGELSTRMMLQKDARVKMMNEVLSGIRVIKFYAWEEQFSSRINRHREAEVNALKGRKYLDALCVYFWATTPVLITFLTFMTYVLLGHQLTAAKVFTSMALFSILIMPLNAFPWVINALIESWVSLKRVETFLQLPDLVWQDYYSPWKGPRQHTVIQILSGYFSWEFQDDSNRLDRSMENHALNSESPDEPITQLLQNISLEISRGQLTGVIGRVGSGKSSLLNAILAEMHQLDGHIAVQGLSHGFGLTTSEAWLQHATVRDNILFGKPMDPKKYNRILKACALIEDLEALPSGDMTEVGERGVTLSGGQKARLSLARAIYQDKDIYIFDDPMSAVDAHVAKHLFEQCIMGLLRNKTRILCTHHTNFLQHADKIVVMSEGRIIQCEIPNVVLNNPRYTEYAEKMREQSDSICSDTGSDISDESAPEQSDVREECSLIQEEEKDSGTVKLQVYKAYWGSVGSCLSPLVLISLFLMQASRNLSDWWLSYWVTQESFNSSHHNSTFQYNITSRDILLNQQEAGHGSNDSVEFYLTVYGGLAGANSLITLVRAFLFAYGGVCAAIRVHQGLLKSILQAPVRFFNVTPLGRIMNRFSTDVYSVDDSLPLMLNTLLAQAFGVIGTLVVCCYGLPWFAALLVPLGIIYYFIQRYYRQTSRELKRITSITRSPIYAHFAETVAGLVTIRALRETLRFKVENREKLEENQKAQYASNAVSQWLSIRLQMIGVTMVTGIAFIAVLEHHFQAVNPGLVGLALSYALSVTLRLRAVVTYFTETEKQMVSMERAEQYIHNIPAEKQWSTLNVPPYWPIQGSISFNHVMLRYRAGLPLALDNVTFDTQPAEKIGIVGRTGSGKSSLFLTLFRMVDIESGCIRIDGINVGHLPLQELRSRLATIPQDPFLFSGTVRENLDPTLTYTIRELWDALKKCHLESVVKRLGGLEVNVGERGRLFSAGEKQLMCLARAMLTHAKVLCIDEATASVDQHTDSLLQQTIRTEFRDNTVLTIAHRLQTVLDSDRVLVMSQGQVAEFDSPSKLLQDTKSLFYQLVHGKSTE